MNDPLLGVSRVDVGLLAHLESLGTVAQTIEGHDSGATAYGVDWAGWRYFVKHVPGDRASGLERARVLRHHVDHSAIPRILNSFATADGLAQVYEWVDGDNVYDHRDRFYSLPVRERLRCLSVIYDVHQMIADAGFIAVDFYDGCLIYDFERRALSLCDFDEYRSDPFTLQSERLPGSDRFMAPEEREAGARIDQVSNVYMLGRAALVLLGDGTGDEGQWGWSDTSLAVVQRATDPTRRHRYQSVAEYLDAWVQTVAMADAHPS